MTKFKEWKKIIIGSIVAISFLSVTITIPLVLVISNKNKSRDLKISNQEILDKEKARIDSLEIITITKYKSKISSNSLKKSELKLQKEVPSVLYVPTHKEFTKDGNYIVSIQLSIADQNVTAKRKIEIIGINATKNKKAIKNISKSKKSKDETSSIVATKLLPASNTKIVDDTSKSKKSKDETSSIVATKLLPASLRKQERTTGASRKNKINDSKIKRNTYLEVDNNYKFRQLRSIYNDNYKKHYFFIMIDSLQSYRLLDTLEKLKRFYKKGISDGGRKLTPNELKIVKEKIDVFNDFELKMNVTTPGYRTHQGLEGVMGGPHGQSTTSEYMRGKKCRLSLLNKTYEYMFKSIGMSNNIDKIYLENTEFYKSRNPHEDGYSEWKLEDVDIPKKAKDKIDVSHINSSLKSMEDFIESIKSVEKDKNTFSLLISDIVHDNTYYTYAIGDEWKISPIKILNMFLQMKRLLIQKGIWDTSEIIITSDHGKGISNSWKNFKDYPYMSQLHDKKVNWIEAFSKDKNLEKFIKYKDISEKASPLSFELATFSSIIMRKKRFSRLKNIDIDYKNTYLNSDAIVQLYHDIGIDPYYLKFNYYNFMKKYLYKQNNIGNYNSFVDDPFNKDLSQRILITLDDNQPDWGYWETANLASKGTIIKGPVWTLDSGKIKYNPKQIIKFRLDKDDRNIKPWLEKWRILQVNKDPKLGGLKVMGYLLSSIDNYLKSS